MFTLRVSLRCDWSTTEHATVGCTWVLSHIQWGGVNIQKGMLNAKSELLLYYPDNMNFFMILKKEGVSKTLLVGGGYVIEMNISLLG